MADIVKRKEHCFHEARHKKKEKKEEEDGRQRFQFSGWDSFWPQMAALSGLVWRRHLLPMDHSGEKSRINLARSAFVMMHKVFHSLNIENLSNPIQSNDQINPRAPSISKLSAVAPLSRDFSQSNSAVSSGAPSEALRTQNGWLEPFRGSTNS